jgi:flagellar assembly protein FliH
MNMSEPDPDFEPWPHWGAAEVSRGRAALPEKSPVPDLRPPTAEELEVLRQAAFEEGFAAGRSEGLRQGMGEVQAQAQRLQSLIASLARPLEQLDARVEEELVALVTVLVRQLVRREIRTEPGAIVAAIREAVAVLPQSARDIAVKVHPEDAALLREVYAEPAGAGGPGWQVVESPAVTRGGCVVVTSTSEVDATVERRLTAVFLHVFGGDRLSDTPAAGGAPAGAGEQRPDDTHGESDGGALP